jgi:hypothetical protein
MKKNTKLFNFIQNQDLKSIKHFKNAEQKVFLLFNSYN